MKKAPAANGRGQCLSRSGTNRPHECEIVCCEIAPLCALQDQSIAISEVQNQVTIHFTVRVGEVGEMRHAQVCIERDQIERCTEVPDGVSAAADGYKVIALVHPDFVVADNIDHDVAARCASNAVVIIICRAALCGH